MRRMMHRLGPELMEYLWELQLADVLSQHPDSLRIKLDTLAYTKKIHTEVVSRGDCVSLKQLAVNGRDLIEQGAQPGKQLGEILESLLADVLDHPELNTRDALLSKAKQYVT